ncbi:MAG: asparagine synthase (glutamine-hydrolyzing), partial [Clostridia bacterium]|nr:asparagine synthase (glutamine-hydrolyzing) [Clostridia bacterium]
IYSNDYAIFQHNRLSVIDPENGMQPMTRFFRGNKYTIIYNGEIYNSNELRKMLKDKGICFETECDTETVLFTYILLKEKTPELLNGIFAFCVVDEENNNVFCARDRFGVKPFYYAKVNSTYIVASEIKAILAHPMFKARLDREGLWQLLYMAPMTISGSGVFKDIFELKPAECGYISKDGFKTDFYWRLKAERWSGSNEEAASITEGILSDAISRQLKSDAPLAVLLSGGLDSSVVTAIAANEYKKNNCVLSTYSFEYEGNKENFKSSLFQPQGDDEYAVFLSKYLGTNHNILTADNLTVADKLFDVVRARDLPGQADIDSSLLYFCNEIKRKHTVVLSGECSDEIFGGYPWFYRPEMLNKDFFPWIHDPYVRINLFRDEFTRKAEGFDFVSSIYKKSAENCPLIEDENDEMKRARKATWLSVNHFGASLLQRKDRMSMYSSVEARVPFADHRLLEFVYNVPWSIKFENGVEKALLRNAMKGKLPDKILNRKKSPYPKTHSPKYESAVRSLFLERLNEGVFLKETLAENCVSDIINGNTGTWFGQLMAGPQLMAWLVQLDYWFEYYNVDLT